MKFLHTSDWQLEMGFKSIQSKASPLRRARVDAVKQIVALADKERVDFVLAAGDLFDDNRIEYRVIEEVAGILSKCSAPVYLLPGNHDPLTPDSPYILHSALFKDSAIALREEKPISFNATSAPHILVTLYPCPARTRLSNQDPTAWIPPRSDSDGIRIGIAHGSIGTPAPDDFPIVKDAARVRELDYLAMGHFHATKRVDERTYYSGTPEPTNFGQTNAGQILIVEIPSAGAVPRVTEKLIAKFSWKDIVRDVHSSDDVDAIVKEVELMSDPNDLLRLSCKGVLPQQQIDRIVALANERIFHLRIETDISLGDGDWSYQHPLLSQMASILTEKANSDSDESVHAKRALSRLAYLAKSAGFRKEDL